jgi:O-antigen ligase
MEEAWLMTTSKIDLTTPEIIDAPMVGLAGEAITPGKSAPRCSGAGDKRGAWMSLRAITAAWAALAVVLTGATQLRMPGLPVGPGEFLLAGWILFVGVLLLCRGTVGLGTVFRAVLVYWLAAFALLGLGALVAIATGQQHAQTASHDFLAFVLAAVASCLFSLRWVDESAERHHLRLARLTFFVCTTVVTALLVLAQVTPTLGSASLWYGGIRFRGWALNPNQMALFALGMPFLGWYLLQRTHGFGRRLAYVAGIGAAIAVGLATQSDALRVAWVGTLGTIGSILWLQSIVRGRGRFLFIPYILVPFATLYLGASFGKDIVLEAQEIVQRMYSELDQGETRLTLWAHGLGAILQSPVVGFGPGAYSGMTGPLQGGEAHNSFIDWGMSTGLSGIALHLALLAWCASRALRAGSLPLFAIVMALTHYSLFGYMLRHPLYWLMLILVLMLTEHRSAQPVRGPARVTPNRLADRPALSPQP